MTLRSWQQLERLLTWTESEKEALTATYQQKRRERKQRNTEKMFSLGRASWNGAVCLSSPAKKICKL